MPQDNQQPNPSSSQQDDTVNKSTVQPTGVVNGQPFSPTPPIPSNQLEQESDQRPSKWRYFFIVLSILQAAGVMLFLLAVLWAVQQAKAGVSGTEFIALYLFVTVVPAVAIISLINLIALPIYLRKHRPHGKGLILSIISLVISSLLVLYGAYNVYGLTIYPKKVRDLSRQKLEAQNRQFADSNAKPEITKDEAISFMQSCKADYFVGYTDINLVKDGNTKSWLNRAEQSSTGIEISEGSPKSYVFASKVMTTALQDTARQFRQSCYNTKKLYITIDDWIETEYPQGNWTRVKQ